VSVFSALEIGRDFSVLRKSKTGVGVTACFVGVAAGGDMILSNSGFDLPTAGLPTMLSGLGFACGGDLTCSVSVDRFSIVSGFLGVESSTGVSEPTTGDFRTGFSSAAGVSCIGAAFVSSLKFDVSSLVVGADIFSDSCSDSCASRLCGLELRLLGLAFAGGVTDLILPASGRMSLESERLSKAGPNGVSLVGDEGLLRSLGFGLPKVGTTSVLVLCAFARAMFSIQLGCAGREAASLGESGLARALSIQLDLFGLKRFEGLPKGDLIPPSSSALVL
jgi:hypothetical protein